MRLSVGLTLMQLILGIPTYSSSAASLAGVGSYRADRQDVFLDMEGLGPMQSWQRLLCQFSGPTDDAIQSRWQLRRIELPAIDWAVAAIMSRMAPTARGKHRRRALG